jgi:hypothetical protein
MPERDIGYDGDLQRHAPARVGQVPQDAVMKVFRRNGKNRSVDRLYRSGDDTLCGSGWKTPAR